MGMSKSEIYTLSSVGKAFRSVDQRWFRTYVTDKPGSVEDCYVGHGSDNDTLTCEEYRQRGFKLMKR